MTTDVKPIARNPCGVAYTIRTGLCKWCWHPKRRHAWPE